MVKFKIVLSKKLTKKLIIKLTKNIKWIFVLDIDVTEVIVVIFCVIK